MKYKLFCSLLISISHVSVKESIWKWIMWIEQRRNNFFLGVHYIYLEMERNEKHFNGNILWLSSSVRGFKFVASFWNIFTFVWVCYMIVKKLNVLEQLEYFLWNIFLLTQSQTQPVISNFSNSPTACAFLWIYFKLQKIH